MPVMESSTAELRDLALTLQKQLETKRDFIVDTRLVSLATTTLPSGGLTLQADLPDGVEEFGITRHAHQQIAEKLDLPWKTYDRLLTKHPDLLGDLGNGLLTRESSKRMVRTLKGNVRAVLSDRYRPRDNWDLVAEVILPEMQNYPHPVWVKECSLTDTRMYVKTVFPDIEKPVTPKVGDVIRGGLIFQNSEVGDGSLGIYPYTDRLSCLNGMVHTAFGQRSIHLGRQNKGEEAWEFFSDETMKLDDAAFYAKCRDTVKAVLNQSVFDAIVSQMQDLAEIRIATPPDKTVEVFTKRNDLSETEGGAMLTALIEGGDLTAWGYVNALTQTARDLDDATRRVELETLAGKLTADAAWALA